MSDAKPKSATVYFDGACPLCTAEICHYRSQPGAEALEFIDISQPGTDPGPDLTQDQALARFHLRRADGTLVSGAAGFAEVWGALDTWRWAARIAALPGMGWVLERLYRVFLPIRPGLSRLFARITGRSGMQPRS